MIQIAKIFMDKCKHRDAGDGPNVYVSFITIKLLVKCENSLGNFVFELVKQFNSSTIFKCNVCYQPWENYLQFIGLLIVVSS